MNKILMIIKNLNAPQKSLLKMVNKQERSKVSFEAKFYRSMTTIPTEADLSLLIKAECQLGGDKVTTKMAPYVFKHNAQANRSVFDLYKTWQKINAAARMLVTIQNPNDICLITSVEVGGRPMSRFARLTNSYHLSQKFTQGTFTNQIYKNFREPMVLIVCDPELDKQPIREASKVNIPVIALCNTNSLLKYVDLAIPCNNRSKYSIATIFFLLCREYMHMKGRVTQENPWTEPVDLFIHKTADDLQVLMARDEKLMKEKEREKKKRELKEGTKKEETPKVEDKEKDKENDKGEHSDQGIEESLKKIHIADQGEEIPRAESVRPDEKVKPGAKEEFDSGEAGQQNISAAEENANASNFLNQQNSQRQFYPHYIPFLTPEMFYGQNQPEQGIQNQQEVSADAPQHQRPLYPMGLPMRYPYFQGQQRNPMEQRDPKNFAGADPNIQMPQGQQAPGAQTLASQMGGQQIDESYPMGAHPQMMYGGMQPFPMNYGMMPMYGGTPMGFPPPPGRPQPRAEGVPQGPRQNSSSARGDYEGKQNEKSETRK